MNQPVETDRISITRRGGTGWTLRTWQSIPRPRDQVFAFFSDATNLERITPPELRFQIVGATPIAMRPGAIIDYRIHLFAIPLRWRTLISVWEPPFEFVDVQSKGPYAEWVHQHRFASTPDDRTLVEDEVRFRLPFSYLGLAGIPLVKHQLRRIFTFRHDAIAAALAT